MGNTHFRLKDRICPKCEAPLIKWSVKNPWVDDGGVYCDTADEDGERTCHYGIGPESARVTSNRMAKAEAEDDQC